MAKKKELTPEELEQQADALLAAADAAEEAGKQAEPKKKSAKRGAAPSEEETPHIMTDEEAKKAGIVRLDDKQVAALPAASWLINQEKLRELLAKGKKRGKLESAELMEAGILSKCTYGVKILGNGELTKKLTVKASAFSESAKAKIEAAGGKAEVV